MDFSWFVDAYQWVSNLFSADTEYLLRTYGYFIILLLTFLEGETIVIIAGMLAAKGLMNPYLIAFTAFAGSWTSDQLMFSLGKYKGSAVLHRFPKLESRMEKATGLFRKYDTALILGFRFVYGVRNVTPIMLGISGISHRKFLLLNFVGAGLWAAAFTSIGYFLHEAYKKASSDPATGTIVKIVLAVIVLAVAYFFWRKKQQNNANQNGQTGS